MTVIFAGVGLVSPAATIVELATILLATCLAAGVSVGAVHGWWLVRMLRTSEREGPDAADEDR